MGCSSQIELASPAHLEAIRARASSEKIPVSGAFDLTYRCNYRCVHCYVGHLVACSPRETGELDTGQVIGLLAEAAEAGCLFMVLSGGEPLLRPDFVEIYESARRLGLIVQVFTNASLLSDEHIRAFAESPPHLVEVSVYGSTRDVYESVTGVPGSFERAMRGIKSLVDGGFRVGIKTMILRENLRDIDAIERLAVDLGAGFRLDPLVTPRIDGGRTPLGHRADPDQAAQVELGTAKRKTDVSAYLERYSEVLAGSTGLNGHMYHCGAGVTSFHIDPQGDLSPCVADRQFRYNAERLGFTEAWRNVVASVEGAIWERAGGCADCSQILLCGYCPGILALEGATPSQPPDYLCQLGASRRRVLSEETSGEAHGHARR